MRLALSGLAVLVTLLCAPAFGAEQRYDYDLLGRLVRSIDSQGRVTEYVYDPAGNLLQVIQGGSAAAPSVTSSTPASIRQKQIRELRVSGTGLANVIAVSDDPNITASVVASSTTQATVRLAVAASARLGAHTLTLRSATGSASAGFDVLQGIEYLVTPLPLAVPPDNVARAFRIEASAADTVAANFSVTTLNPAIASAGAAVSIAAGATQGTSTITGIAAGSTILRLTGSELIGTIDLPVDVTTQFAGATVSRARPVGLVRGDPTAPSSALTSGPVLSRGIGLVKGDPTAPSANAPSGPVLSPAIGLQKP